MQTCPACYRWQTYIPIFTDTQQPFIWIIGTGNAKLEANLHASNKQIGTSAPPVFGSTGRHQRINPNPI